MLLALTTSAATLNADRELPFPLAPRTAQADEDLCSIVAPHPLPPSSVSGRAEHRQQLRVHDGPEPEALIIRAPPPSPMPVGRGMTYAMENPEPYYSQYYSAVYASVPQYRNAALLDHPKCGVPSTLRSSEHEKNQAHATEGPERSQPTQAAANTGITPDSGTLSMLSRG